MNGLKKFVADNPERFERFISRVEMVGLVAAVIAVVLMSRRIDGGSLLLSIGLSMLAFVYVFTANTVPELFRVKSRSFSIPLQAGYIGLAITMMGILFSIQNWPGGTLQIQVGCAVTGALFLFFTYKMYFGTLEDESHRMVINNLIVRMLPALVVAAILIALYFRT